MINYTKSEMMILIVGLIVFIGSFFAFDSKLFSNLGIIGSGIVIGVVVWKSKKHEI